MKRSDSRWKHWRRSTAAAVDQLATATAAGALPVRLPEIARARKVREVVFRPLLVDGCLGVRGDGFVIFVGCEKRNSSDLNKAWSFGHPADRSLSARIRFTIAHEIAHTFFFDVEASPPRPTLDLKNPRTVSSLEQTCNQLAARILLPEPLFQKSVHETDVLDPVALRQLANKSGVSPHVLTVRLKQSFDWPDSFGAVLCVRHEGNGPKVLCKAMHYSLRSILGDDRDVRALWEWMSDPRFALNGGDEAEVKSYLPCSIGRQRAVQELVWRCEDVTPAIGSSYFVTVSRAADLQLLNPAA